MRRISWYALPKLLVSRNLLAQGAPFGAQLASEFTRSVSGYRGAVRDCGQAPRVYSQKRGTTRSPMPHHTASWHGGVALRRRVGV